jgi:hypoxanthine phosphoribosyltransferase
MRPAAPEIERILYTEEQVEERIAEVGAQISEKYRGCALKLIGVLKGSVFFLTALARRIDIPVKIDFLAISSFSSKTTAPGLVRIAKDLDESIEGEDVMLVEDIVDTGFTARYLLQTLAARGPPCAPCSTAPRAGSSRFLSSSAASKSPTALSSGAVWTTGSSTGTSVTLP